MHTTISINQGRHPRNTQSITVVSVAPLPVMTGQCFGTYCSYTVSVTYRTQI